MSMLLIPQLPDGTAEPLLSGMARSPDAGVVRPAADLSHSQAYVMPSGGLEIPRETLQQLRDGIVAAAAAEGFPDRRPDAAGFRAFETAVARTLADWDPLWLDGVPSGEAMRRPCWTFLTVIVLPDVAIWRWPPGEKGTEGRSWRGRMLGGTRNAFQRILRRVISLDRGPSHPDRWGLIRDLLEDDFSNILERPSLGSNPRIATCLAEEYLAMRERLEGVSAAIQQEIYRNATKALCAYGVVQALDVMPRSELESLIREEFARQESLRIPREGAVARLIRRVTGGS